MNEPSVKAASTPEVDQAANPPEARLPLRCRLGIHAWYLDAAMFSSCNRCDRCGVYSDPFRAQMLARERAAWSEADSKGDPWGAMARAAAAVLRVGDPDA